jgi:hypothetical protein
VATLEKEKEEEKGGPWGVDPTTGLKWPRTY